MIQFIYELNLNERVTAKCSRHRRYNPRATTHLIRQLQRICGPHPRYSYRRR
jgi:hypothetical protein